MAMHDIPPLLALEQQLADDTDGTSRAVLLSHLEALHARLTERRRQPNPREVERKLAGAQAAVQGAIDAVHRITVPDWARAARPHA